MYGSLFICWTFALVVISAVEHGFPAPLTSANRVLSMVVAYSLSRLDPMMHILKAQQNMCEGGWNTTVVVFTSATPSIRMRKFLEGKVYCHRTQVI